MYRNLRGKELKSFIQRYFKEWGNDIKKVSVINYNELEEYLINDSFIFTIKVNA